jgi:GMP synthase-like glutamine amidotransferase
MTTKPAPVLVLQHLHNDGPAYLGTWLRARGVDWVLRNAQGGDPFPESIDGFAALAILGGAMSANDPLPTLRHSERLILEAMARDVPVLGHCLGGQLMARALGARVTASPAPEIGWVPMQVLDDDLARDWFGRAGEHVVMHWHYEAFDLPPGARRLAGSAACANQAFAIGPHLAMQFHVEIDAPKLDAWSAEASDAWRRAAAAHPATVQDGGTMRARGVHEMARHQALADRIYGRWLSTTGWSSPLP